MTRQQWYPVLSVLRCLRPYFLSGCSESKDPSAGATGVLWCASTESLSAAVTLGSFDYAQDDGGATALLALTFGRSAPVTGPVRSTGARGFRCGATDAGPVPLGAGAWG